MSLAAAESAVRSIGLGYDLSNDLRLKYVKQQSSQGRLITFPGDDELREMWIPGVGSIANVSKPINCTRGGDEERGVRICSDVLSFHQMSEQFNQDLSVGGKIPSGQFNAEFDLRHGWEKDVANTKSLAFDGVFLTLYTISLERLHLQLADHVKLAIPSIWDPDALSRFHIGCLSVSQCDYLKKINPDETDCQIRAPLHALFLTPCWNCHMRSWPCLCRFISEYGTHVIVGIKMGGKDVVYVKQQHSSSPLHPRDVQKKLKEVAGELFVDMNNNGTQSGNLEHKELTFEHKRKGGSITRDITHNEWIQTVPLEPEVISAMLVPISSLLIGINGSGFLTHAINLYMRYKPPIEELHQFLEFQLPRQWAPVFGELPLQRERLLHRNAISLGLGFFGPKLYINTTPIDVGNRPVTGMRLYLEGKASNYLAIHMQHLASQPTNFKLTSHQTHPIPTQQQYYEKLCWNSHVCTAPVESHDDLCIVTGSHFEVGHSGRKKVLFLRLHFSKVVGVSVMKRSTVWDCPPSVPNQSWGLTSSIESAKERPVRTDIGSAVYPGGPPVPTRRSKLVRFVDATEMARGPGDSPGYWVVSGARLMLEKGKLCLQVKYSLLMKLVSSHNNQDTTLSSEL